MGSQPAKLKAADWDGTWIRSGGSVSVKVLDADQGTARIGWVEEKSGAFTCSSHDIFFRKTGDWLFASMADEGTNRGLRYVWGRVKNDDGVIVIWVPDPSKFRALVEDGDLPGAVEDKNVALGKLDEKHLKLITSGEAGLLFAWDSPIVLMRLAE
jgi:hypothetical protein